MAKRLTTAEFIERARVQHGDRYQYSKTVYKNRKQPVVITCSAHGDFEQNAANHMRGWGGCPKCSGRRLNTKKYIERVSKKHGHKYDYSHTVYTKSTEKVTIICPAHGPFKKDAADHMRGSGCPACSGYPGRGGRTEGVIINRTTEEFIAESKAANGGKYGYLKTRYRNTQEKVEIECYVHGTFWQVAWRHLAGDGCPKCGRESGANKRKLSTKEFVEKSRAVHQGKYSYGKAVYKGSKVKLTITCPEHGDFEQIPNSHLLGQGCALCCKRFYDPCAVYVTASPQGTKIGIARDPIRRHRLLSYGQPMKSSLHSLVTCANWPTAYTVEAAIHRELADLNCGYTGFDGATEWFNIEPAEAIALVKRKAAEMDALV